MEIINFEWKEMIPLADEVNKSYEKQKRYICKKEFCYDKNKEKKNWNYIKPYENLEEQLIVFAI